MEISDGQMYRWIEIHGYRSICINCIHIDKYMYIKLLYIVYRDGWIEIDGQRQR